MVPEGRGVFGALTIEENLAMGAYVRNDKTGIRQDVERVFDLFPRLKERRRQTAGTLSGGEQQMLAMARALMSTPTLLLLDEPSMGLAPLMVQKVFETVMRVSGEGVTILLIEQNAKLALEVSNRGYVMESGEITLSGPAKTLLHDPAVRAAYLGESPELRSVPRDNLTARVRDAVRIRPRAKTGAPIREPFRAAGGSRGTKTRCVSSARPRRGSGLRS
jgi:branched-chain amino acid transport system ATP-binding protein